MYPKVLDLGFTSIGPKEPIPSLSIFLSLKNSTTFAKVISGVSVGKLILSSISTFSLPTPQTNFVPPD